MIVRGNEVEAVATKEDPKSLVLRGPPRPIVRFRRGLILSAAGTVAASLVAFSLVALEPPTVRKADALPNSEAPAHVAPPDALAAAPKTYEDVPKLGPPLPGDLGRPIVEHERALGRVSGDGFSGAESQQTASNKPTSHEGLVEGAFAARTSAVLVQLRLGEGNREGPLSPVEQRPGNPGADTASTPPPATLAPQQQLELTRTGEQDFNKASPHPGRAGSMLAAGTVIPASLLTGVNSDIPGMVIAQVTQNVRDTATGTFTLIPQGARLIGHYDSVVAFGQRRALLLWTRILFPDGASIDLDNMPATDVSGYAGLSDKVDFHTWQLLKGIALSTLFGVGAQLSLANSGSDLVRAIRESAQQSTVNAGAEITKRDLALRPSITIRPGWPVRAILNKDLVLEAKKWW